MNEVLPASINAAKQLGAKTIMCFGFGRQDSVEVVASALRQAAEKVGAAGLTLALEPHEPSQRVGDIVREANHPALGINWDPANIYASGEDTPFPDGYAHVRPFVKHVHFKDARLDPVTGKRSWVLDGVIDWTGIIHALKQDNYEGYVSVETHLRPKVESTRRTLERVRALVAEA